MTLNNETLKRAIEHYLNTCVFAATAPIIVTEVTATSNSSRGVNSIDVLFKPFQAEIDTKQ